jgi:glutamin-(asparagin-)ase
MTELPRITILATGGTIAGSATSATDTTGYRAATTGVDDVIAAVPELADVATVTGDQFSQLDSADVTDDVLIALARRVAELQADPEVDGIVITHGTDTLEESAYFLHLVLTSTKPVVLVGAMRPPTALSADGPRNLWGAVVAAATPTSAGCGVLVVMNDEIHSARDVTKTSSGRVDAFSSPHGPVGAIVDGAVRWYRIVRRPRPTFPIPHALPRTAIVYAHTGLDAAQIDAMSGFDVIVHAGFGNGTVSTRIVDALERQRASGVLIVRASRAPGPLTLVGASDPRVTSWPVVDDEDPARARLFAALARTVTSDPAKVQLAFTTY